MVDYFAIVDFKTEQIAWLSSNILDTHVDGISLRFEETKRNRTKDIKFFEDYITIPF